MYLTNEMASSERDMSFRRQDTAKRSFQRRLQYFKDNLSMCYYVSTKYYAFEDGKRVKVHTPIYIPRVCNLDEYYWLQMSASEKFYGFGRQDTHYVLFCFNYDNLEEPKLKVIFSTSRENLIQYCMNEKIYKKYMKDTTTN